MNVMRKMFRNPCSLSLAVLFVQYDQKKYGNAFEILRNYLSAIRGAKITYFRIDNNGQNDDEITLVGQDVYLVRGENRFREFSGWQKGIDAVQKISLGPDVVLLTNEAFLAPGESYLKYHASDSLLKKVIAASAALGRIDSHGETTTVYAYDTTRWICSNALFVPWQAMVDLGDIVSVKDNIHDFVPVEYDQGHLCGSQEMDVLSWNDGHFEFSVDIAQPGLNYLRIQSEKGFRPVELGINKDQRKISFLVNDMNCQALGDGKIELLSGWYSWPHDRWVAPNCSLAVTAEKPGTLLIKGFVPQEITLGVYGGQFRTKVFNDSLLFKRDAPISDNYKRLLVQWFTQRWHSKFDIGADSWALFVSKLRAILNEVLLSARLVRLGYKLKSYGSKLYY